MIQVMLGYPQIYTDMVFENVSTLPLEQRAGIECCGVGSNENGRCNDGDEILPSNYKWGKRNSSQNGSNTGTKNC